MLSSKRDQKCGGGNWRIFRFFFSGQETEIKNRCAILEELLGRLKEDEPQKVECCKWLSRASHAVHSWPVPYSDYDVAWGALQEIRNKLSLISALPRDDLIRIALDISDDIPYIADAKKRDQARKDIDKIIEGFASPLEDDRKIAREHIFRLSLLSGNARSSYWHRVNVLRARLFMTAIWITVIGLAIILFICIRGTDLGLTEQHPIVVLVVVLFGALGGFLSALQRQEPLGGRSVDFYLERSTLILRPVIGAAAGLVVYILVLSSLVSMIGIQSATSPWAYFFVAFCAGFSERFFLKQIAVVLDREREERASRE